jgi:FdhE protein
VTQPVRSRAAAQSFEQHAARADELARAATSEPAGASAENTNRAGAGARKPLRFAAGLLRVQAEVAARLDSAASRAPLSGRLASDTETVLETLREVPAFAAREGPAPLREEARERASESIEVATIRLALYWRGDQTAREDYLSRAMLRPYVRVLREWELAPDRARAPRRCPFCGGAPLVGCRRSSAESEGAARSLVCGLCELEWSFPRILCPSCGENSPHKLPSFAGDAHPIARIEACETCRRYVKSLDLTHEPRAVPEVDDLLSMSLDLWAIDQGFTRLEPGLAGL